MPAPNNQSPRSPRPPAKQSGNVYDRDLDDILFYILLAIALASIILGILRGDFFKGILSTLAPIGQTRSLSDVDTPVGGSIVLTKGTAVFSEDGKQIGYQPAGAKGVVAGGPIYINGERYWYVDFESGQDGWVPESALGKAGGGKFDPGDTPVGSKVTTANDSSIYDAPGGRVIGTQPKGAKGIVTAGPKYANGDRYWYVDFESGQDGWVKEKDLRSEDGSPFRPGSTPVGSKVVATKDADVLDSPGGKKIGSHKAGDRGVITDGPRWVNGKRYWYVDFENGADGWVEESQIELVPQETAFGAFVSRVRTIFHGISTLLSIFFLTGIIYSIIRLVQVTRDRALQFIQKEKPARTAISGAVQVNRRWEKVIIHVQSENPSDWRLAILEADIMLAEMLDRMGYAGENVGEKLKTIERSDFESLDDAWEAHRVRNQVAHQGSDYVLSRREAERVVSLYANVFREFKYI